MPVYCYRCKDCNECFEVKHSMTYDGQECVFCESDKVFKLPFISKRVNISSEKKPGQIVKKFIEDTKKEIKEEKKMLRSEEM